MDFIVEEYFIFIGVMAVYLAALLIYNVKKKTEEE